MAAETNQISPSSPSSSPAPLPSSAAAGPASSPEAPRDDPPEQEAAPEDPWPEDEEESEDEEDDNEEDGEDQHEAKRRRFDGPAALTKLVSFSFDVRSNAGTPVTTPRFGSDAFLFPETKDDVWATGGAVADRGEEQQQDEGEEEGRSEE